MVYEVEAIFSQSAGLEPRKTLNWGSLFCAVPSTLSNIQEWVHPVEDVPFIVLHILAALSNAFFFSRVIHESPKQRHYFYISAIS